MSIHRFSIVLAVGVLTATATIAQDTAYRVAGIIAIDEQRAVALIESSAGSQKIYRPGDYIDDWEVIGIGLDAVTLGRTGQIVRLSLEGKMAPLAEQVEDTPDPGPIRAGSSSLNFDRAFQKLQVLELKPGPGEQPLTYADVNKALGLSAATLIREIDGEMADSPMAVVQLSIAALATENAFRLTVSENQLTEIYLVPIE
jgi:hypothetical protein